MIHERDLPGYHDHEEMHARDVIHEAGGFLRWFLAGGNPGHADERRAAEGRERDSRWRCVCAGAPIARTRRTHPK